MEKSPKLELISWEGCPSTEEAIQLCYRAARELGIGLEIVRREINDYKEAQLAEFVGSPTFRVAGIDLYDSSGQQPGLSCRVYTKPNGKFGPLPDFEDFKSRLSKSIR